MALANHLDAKAQAGGDAGRQNASLLRPSEAGLSIGPVLGRV